jgi:uncharacterized membrane protein YfcA
MPPSVSVPEILSLLFAIGCVGGFLSGLLGVGGGILFVPALYFSMSALGLDSQHAMHLAVGTSLAVVFATGSVSALGHHRRGGVDVKIMKSWGMFIVGGVVIGSFFATAVNGEVLKRIFAAVTFFLSFYMAFGKERPVDHAKQFLTVKIQHGICVGIGMVSSMIGVGGAILTVPMMSYIGTPMTRAMGTGAALGMLISLPGTIGYMLAGLPHLSELPPYSAGYVNLLAVALIIPASMFMAPVGVKASHGLPHSMLRRIFAAVMLIVSIRMFMTL